MSILRVKTLESVTRTLPVSQTILFEGSIRTWVSGDGAAVVQEDLNVSSGTDNGTGNFNYSYTNSMSTSTYSIGACGRAKVNDCIISDAQATGDIDIYVRELTGAGVLEDREQGLELLGDLA